MPDPRIELVKDNAVGRVRELKQEAGMDIWLCGGGALAATLRNEIDEIHLKLNPVVIGRGAPLLDGDFHIDRYDLTSTRPFGSGVVLLTYAHRR